MDDKEIVRKALNILARRHRKGSPLSCPNITRDYLKLRLEGEYNEVFGCIFLDNHNRVIKIEELFQGTIDGATVHPRVVVQRALMHNAAALVLYHNHPSGIAEPSRADISLTKRLCDALALVDIRVIDHMIVGDDEYVSFAERGYL